LADYEFDETIVEFESNGEVFRATGRTVINLGWQGWDKGDSTDKDKSGDSNEDGDSGGDGEILPTVREGERGAVEPSIADKTTSPPKPYTYHALLAAMNGIHKHVKDPAIRAKLKELQGIGTEATQESIISTLFDRGYIEKKKKIVVSTALGKLLIDLMSADEKTAALAYPDMTALWEKRMDEIQNGRASLDDFVAEVAGMAREIVSGRLNVPGDIPGMARLPECLTDGCGGYLRRVTKPGKNAFYSCSLCHSTFDEQNGAPVPKKEKLPELGEAPCPMNCGGMAKKYEGKYGFFWKCTCSPNVIFKDAGGLPVVRETRVEAPCPVKGCKGKAVRFERKADNRPFWKCAACHNFFDDRDGVPMVREQR
jgi:DNA topoisomerase-3